MRATQVSIRWF